MRGVLRSLPVFAPGDVRTMIGRPRRSFASWPFVASYRSTCLRAQRAVLGTYSPVRGMPQSCHETDWPRTAQARARSRIEPAGSGSRDARSRSRRALRAGSASEATQGGPTLEPHPRVDTRGPGVGAKWLGGVASAPGTRLTAGGDGLAEGPGPAAEVEPAAPGRDGEPIEEDGRDEPAPAADVGLVRAAA